MNALWPGYFKTMKIPFLEGRDFVRMDFKENCDGRHRQPQVRRALLQGTSAVGKHIGWVTGPNSKLTIEIVGVVADSLYEAGEASAVRSSSHFGSGSAAFYVRTTMPASAATPLVRNEVKQQ